VDLHISFGEGAEAIRVALRRWEGDTRMKAWSGEEREDVDDHLSSIKNASCSN